MSEVVLNYTLLENGLDFVREALVGLCELSSKDDVDDNEKKRIMKYSLLHLSSGMELVFKNILLEEHWTYVFQDMNKANQKDFASGNLRSVDSETLVDRLENFCDINFCDNDKKNLKRLREYRNKTEHFAVEYNVFAMENIIHKCISIIIEVVAYVYDEDKMGEIESNLLQEIKQLLKQFDKHYKDAILLTQKELDRLLEIYEDEIIVTMCPSCNEKYLITMKDKEPECLFCHEQFTACEAAKSYISNDLCITEYELAKDGGEWPQYECTECGEEALVFDYPDNEAICFRCGTRKSLKEFEFCSRCGVVIAKDNDIGICNECWNYITRKD